MYASAIFQKNEAKGKVYPIYSHPILKSITPINADESHKFLALEDNEYIRIIYQVDIGSFRKRIARVEPLGNHPKSLEDALFLVADDLENEARKICNHPIVQHDKDLKTLSDFFRIESETIAYTLRSRFDMESKFVDVGGIQIKNTDLQLIEALLPVESNILMVGASGTGKTSIPEAIAKKHGLKYLRVNCSTIRDPEEFFGYREAKSGSTVFDKSSFASVLESGNAIIVLDEINRLEPWLINGLLPILDHDRSTEIHNIKISVGKNVTIFATMNLGGKFTGIFALDAAIRNRFDATIFCNYLPSETEKFIIKTRFDLTELQSEKIVFLIGKIRDFCAQKELDIDVSTRTTLKLAKLFKQGIPLDIACGYTIINNVAEIQVLKNLQDLIQSNLS